MRRVQIFYNPKDLKSCLSHICSSPKPVTLTARPNKLKSLGCSVKHKQDGWAKQLPIRLHYDCCTVTTRKGGKNYLPLKMSIYKVQRSRMFSSSFKRQLLFFFWNLFFTDNIYNSTFSLQLSKQAKKRNKTKLPST